MICAIQNCYYYHTVNHSPLSLFRASEKSTVTPFFLRTVGIDPDRRTLRLNRTLKNRHLAESHSTGHWNYTLAAEVGLLTRNIVIEGADDENQVLDKQSFGCRVLIGSFGGSSAINRRVRVENVEFRHCGQEGWSDEYDPRYINELNLL